MNGQNDVDIKLLVESRNRLPSTPARVLMIKETLLFFMMLILCLNILGCDEGMIDPMQLAQVADNISHYETTVQTEIPDEVLAAMKLKADEMSKIT